MHIPNKIFSKYMRNFKRKTGRNWQILHYTGIFQDHSEKLRSQSASYTSKIKLQIF